jgi:hypothetical protein
LTTWLDLLNDLLLLLDLEHLVLDFLELLVAFLLIPSQLASVLVVQSFELLDLSQ